MCIASSYFLPDRTPNIDVIFVCLSCRAVADKLREGTQGSRKLPPLNPLHELGDYLPISERKKISDHQKRQRKEHIRFPESGDEPGSEH